MSVLAWVFLESPAALGVLAGLALFGLLVHWRRTLRSRPLLIGLLVAAASFALQNAVVTQREQAGRILDAIQKDLLQSRPDAIVRNVGDPFRAGGMDREEFLQLVSRKLRSVRIYSLSRFDLVITRSAPDEFEVAAGFLSRINMSEFGDLPLRTRWMLGFARTPDGWRIRQIEPVSLEGQTNVSWATYSGH
ncbi:MAG: hypothetical protein HZB38_14580 [Planctomycetes bacterium]|nr:hypothetical protein [Planctomycetota bacterium]